MSSANERAEGVAFAVRTLGCKVNRVESESIAADLLGNGACLVDGELASVVVVNTCTVTAEADAKARKAVRQALRGAASPVVVVTGCLAALDADGLRALSPRVVVEADKDGVASRVAALLGLPADPARRPEPPVRTGGQFRTRALIKIEDGCDNFCTYCIVPHARGGPRGIPMEHVVNEATSLVAAGTREIVLTGINIGRYRDALTGADLADLVAAVAGTGVVRLRLSSIEPPDLTARLLGVLGTTPAVCEHLHVPLQSGSDAVLSAMGRTYTTEEFAQRIAAARAALPGLAVTTDVIAGFPGETDEQHAETLGFVARMRFAKLHVFRYSVRPGTPAAHMVQIAAEVRSSRASELRRLGAELRESYVESRVGCQTEVLVERVDAGRATGTTRDYLRVEVPGSGSLAGETRVVALNASNVLP